MGKKLKNKKIEYANVFSRNSRQGMLAFLNGHYSIAIEFCTLALKVRPQDSDTLSNRALAYIRVKAYESARRDLAAVMNLEGLPSVKTLRRLSALKWAVQEYDDLISTLEKAQRSYEKKRACDQSEMKEIIQLLKTSTRMKCESLSGHYNMENLILRHEQTYNCGEYFGPVEVRPVPEKGRGLFATSEIKAGSTIIGCKAFAVLFPTAEEANDENYDYQRNQMKLVNVMMEMISTNPDLKQQLFQLYSGSTRTPLKFGDPVPDMTDQETRNYIKDVVLYSGLMSTSNPKPRTVPNPEKMVDDDNVKNLNTWALWYWASFVNHSCVDNNVDFQKFGDFLIIRAIRNISAGEELVINYNKPFAPYNKRNLVAPEESGNPSFTVECKCRLCELDRAEPEEMHLKRENLEKLVQEHPTDDAHIREYGILLENVVEQLEEMRADNPDLNFPIFFLCEKIAIHNTELLGMIRKGTLYLEKAYNLISSSALCNERFGLLVKICINYIILGVDELARKWVSTLKDEMILYFQTYNVLPAIIKQHNVSPEHAAMLLWYFVEIKTPLRSIEANEKFTIDFLWLKI